MTEATKTAEQSFQAVTRNISISFAIILSLTFAVSGQLPAGLETANSIIENSQATSDAERAAALRKALNALSAAATSDPNTAELEGLMNLEADWLDIDNTALYDITRNAVQATDQKTRRAELEKARLELLQRAAFLMNTLDPKKLTPEDAERISKVMQTALRALDEASSPTVLEPKYSTLTKLLGLGNELIKLKNSVTDPKARDILEGLSGTLGTFGSKLAGLGVSMPGPFKAFAYPSAIIGRTQDNIDKAWQHTATAVSLLPDIMDDDPKAKEQFQKEANEVNRYLSPDNLGKAMIGAMTDQTLGQIPFFGTIRNWFHTDVPYVSRRLGLTVDCAGTYSRELQPIIVSQRFNRITAVTDSATSCYPQGEILFEGVLEEGNVYSVVIYRIWDQNEKKGLLRGKVVIQMRNFVRMEAVGMYSNSSLDSKYLTPYS